MGEAPVRQLLRVPPGVLAVSLLLTGATWGSLLAAVVVPPLLWSATHSVWTVLATALPLLGAAGASSVGRFVGEYDWTVGESPDGLRIDHGLLDRTHETVPPGRVQTVRIVRAAAVAAARVGAGRAGRGRVVATPCSCRSPRARWPRPSSRGCCPG